MQTKNKSLVLLIPLTFLVVSCGKNGADIKAAQQLAKLHDDATTIFPKLANDVYDSCLRQAELTRLKPPTENSGEIDQDRKAAREICEKEPKEASNSLKDANQVILVYLQDLGKLVSDDVVNYDNNLDGINTSLKNLPGLTDDENQQNVVDAGTEIAKVIFKMATNGYRRNQLKSVVIETNDSLTTLTNGLDKAVTKGYLGVLNNEQVALDSYYQYYLGQILTAPATESPSAQATAEYAFDEGWKKANSNLESKKELATDYLSLLKQIATDHQKLKQMYVKGKEPSATQVKQMVDGYTKDLKSITKKSEILFPNN